MPDSLSRRDVQRLAGLARLHLSEEDEDAFRRELSTVLDHIARLQQLDLDEIEPAEKHASGAKAGADDAKQLDDDEPAEPLDASVLLENAPAVEQRFIAVPRVLEQ